MYSIRTALSECERSRSSTTRRNYCTWSIPDRYKISVTYTYTRIGCSKWSCSCQWRKYQAWTHIIRDTHTVITVSIRTINIWFTFYNCCTCAICTLTTTTRERQRCYITHRRAHCRTCSSLTRHHTIKDNIICLTCSQWWNIPHIGISRNQWWCRHKTSRYKHRWRISNSNSWNWDQTSICKHDCIRNRFAYNNSCLIHDFLHQDISCQLCTTRTHRYTDTITDFCTTWTVTRSCTYCCARYLDCITDLCLPCCPTTLRHAIFDHINQWTCCALICNRKRYIT